MWQSSSHAVTWGIFRPRIIFPTVAPEWSEKRRRIVLHELAHIAVGTGFLQICATGLRVLLVHPPALLRPFRSHCGKDDAWSKNSQVTGMAT